MRFDLNIAGEWVVDPNELADKLGTTTAFLKEGYRRGLIWVTVVSGQYEDAGSNRITIRGHDLFWQGTFGPKGALISERFGNN